MATAAATRRLRDMETWNLEEALNEDQMKILKIAMSRCVCTKKYHHDGTFDKYKCRVIGDTTFMTIRPWLVV